MHQRVIVTSLTSIDFMNKVWRLRRRLQVPSRFSSGIINIIFLVLSGYIFVEHQDIKPFQGCLNTFLFFWVSISTSCMMWDFGFEKKISRSVSSIKFFRRESLHQPARGISNDDSVHSSRFSLWNDKIIQVRGAGPRQGGAAPPTLQPATFLSF